MRKRGGKGVDEGAHRPLAPSRLNRGGRESLPPGTVSHLRLLGTPVGQRPDPFAFSRQARAGGVQGCEGRGRFSPRDPHGAAGGGSARPGPSGQARRRGPRSAGEKDQGRPGCKEKSGIDFKADNP